MSKGLADVSKKERALIQDVLNTAAHNYDSAGVVVKFIDNVLTEGEKMAVGRRILVARMILNGHTYYEINEQLQVSPNTFSQVRKWLDGQMPG